MKISYFSYWIKSIIQFSFVLLANQYPEYPASAQDPVEGDNDRLTDELKGKIHKLKSVSRKICVL